MNIDYDAYDEIAAEAGERRESAVNIREMRDTIRFVEFEHPVGDAKNVLVDVFLEMADDEWILSLATQCHPYDEALFVTNVVFVS